MIITCLHCPAKMVDGQACEIYARATKAIRGSGVTSAKIRCEKRKALFRPGQYVTFLGVNRTERGDDWRSEMEQYFGWIWKFNAAKSKWLICGEDTDSPFVRIRPDRITVLGDLPKRCCIHCGKPEGVADRYMDKGSKEQVDYHCRGHYEERGLWNGEWVEDGCEYPERRGDQ